MFTSSNPSFGGFLSDIRPIICLLALFMTVFPGCSSFSHKKPERPPAKPIPSLTGTQGEMRLVKAASILFQFKDIQMAINPGALHTKETKDAARQLDYGVLTELTQETIPNETRAFLKKDLKIILPPSGEKELQNMGFQQVKGLAPGRHILLKKNGGFLFLTAIPSGAASGQEQMSYLLEFDHGRNVFIGARIESADLLKSAVYEMRDDGKEVHLALMNPVSLKGESSEQHLDRLSEITSLLQPRLAIFQNANIQESELQKKTSGKTF